MVCLCCIVFVFLLLVSLLSGLLVGSWFEFVFVFEVVVDFAIVIGFVFSIGVVFVFVFVCV